MTALLAIALLCLGLFLVAHDLFYHLGLVPGLGREMRVGRARIHHGYVGLLLMLLGAVLLMAFL